MPARSHPAYPASMAHPRLQILNMPHARDWEERLRLPRFLQPVEMSLNPCVHCPGHCCVPQGAITMVEALRIALLLRVPLQHVVEKRRVDPGHPPAPHATPIPLDEGDVLLFLQVGAHGQCVFLHRLGERGFCSIYDARPGMCCVYPHEVQWKGRRLSVGNTVLCPVQWMQDDAAVARVTRALTAWDNDAAVERRLIRTWSRRRDVDRTYAAFVEHAVRTLARKLGVDAEEVLRPPRRRLK